VGYVQKPCVLRIRYDCSLDYASMRCEQKMRRVKRYCVQILRHYLLPCLVMSLRCARSLNDQMLRSCLMPCVRRQNVHLRCVRQQNEQSQVVSLLR
jgi:hypothetical protein